MPSDTTARRRLWRILEGHEFCQLASGPPPHDHPYDCVTDGEGLYGGNEACTFELTRAAVVVGTEYQVEGGQFDYLLVEAPGFTPGFPRPPERARLEAGTRVRWQTDASVHFGGFTLCASPDESPAAPPTMPSSVPQAASVSPSPTRAPSPPQSQWPPALTPREQALSSRVDSGDAQASSGGARHGTDGPGAVAMDRDTFVGIVASCAACTLLVVIVAIILVRRRRHMHARGTRTIVTAVPMTTIHNPVANQLSSQGQAYATASASDSILQPLDSSDITVKPPTYGMAAASARSRTAHA